VERFRGRADLALNDTGRKQAEAAASGLNGLSVAAIYTSPLRRALETANIISKHLSVSVQLSNSLIDIDYGSWQGLSPEDAVKQYPELYTKWIERPQEVRFPGGEGLGGVRSRVMGVVEQFAARHHGETVVLVSHKVVCQVLLYALLGLDDSHFWQIGQDVNAINSFEISDAMTTVTSVNDTCHLKALTAGR